mmetsp:Transcript_6566/g.25529  ORF Transcript_6566/g.25529 Transcript_6566/m.25529 type:complete len:206 (-) Transcript_6566:780-1397(-)
MRVKKNILESPSKATSFVYMFGVQLWLVNLAMEPLTVVSMTVLSSAARRYTSWPVRSYTFSRRSATLGRRRSPTYSTTMEPAFKNCFAMRPQPCMLLFPKVRRSRRRRRHSATRSRTPLPSSTILAASAMAATATAPVVLAASRDATSASHSLGVNTVDSGRPTPSALAGSLPDFTPPPTPPAPGAAYPCELFPPLLLSLAPLTL